MKLYCVRHGEAESAHVDPDRPLTEMGKLDVEKMARYMGEVGLHIDYLMYSPKLRAVQTAEIFAKYLNATQVKQCQTLLDEMNEVEPLIEKLPAWHADTMLVGHFPFMHKLINALLERRVDTDPIFNCPPGTVICLERYNQDHWIITWLLNPQFVM